MRVFLCHAILAVLAASLSLSAWAQDGVTQGVPPVDFAFSGLSIGVGQANLDALNDALQESGYGALPPTIPFAGQTTLFGMAGGLRAGGVTVRGSTRSQVAKRRADLDATLWGGLVDWPCWLLDGRARVGVMVGGLSAILTLVDHNPSSFEDALRTPFRSRLSQWQYVAEPSLVTESTPVEGIDLRLRLGYLFAWAVRPWTTDGVELRSPTRGLSGPRVQFSFQIRLEPLISQWVDSADDLDRPIP